MFGCHKRYINIIGVIVRACQDIPCKAGVRLGTRHRGAQRRPPVA
jgi:hypothetical protein